MIVVILVGIIVYTFRDSAGPILEQLKKTTPAVVAGICVMTMVYHVVEGLITMVLAKQYQPGFTWGMGITNALYCSFYRVATLGSGAGVAAIYYLNEHGVSYGQAFGLYMLQYAFHKISIALFSLLFFGLSWEYMLQHFSDYGGLLAAGYGITVVITLGLILFCCSKGFHRLLFWVLDFVNGKLKHRFDPLLSQLREQCGMMEEASKHLLKRKSTVAGVIALNILKLCFWYAIPYLVFGSEDVITLPQVMAVTSLSVMLAAVIPAPAGIGSTEFVFTSLFSKIVGTGMAGSASLLYRFGTFVFPFAVGAVIVAARHIRAGKKEKSCC